MKKYIFLTFILLFKTLSGQVSDDIKNETDKLWEKEDYKSLVKYYNELIATDTLNASYYITRGNSLLKLHMYEDALSDYTKAISIDPGSVDPYFARGNLYMSIQKGEKAIKDFTSAIEITDENDSLHYAIFSNRGSAKASIRDFQGAYEDYLAVLAFDSTDMVAHTNIGIVLDNLGREEEATEHLKTVIRLYPDFEGGYGNLAFRYMEMGKYEEAVDLNNKVLEMDPGNPYAYNNRGFAKYKMGDIKGALKDIDKSIKLYPNNSYAYRNRALINIDLKKYKNICEDIDMALRLGFTQMYGNEVVKLKKQYCGYGY